jgi:DNA modification methylase
MMFNTKTGDVCYEPFAGSGSQFVAGEQLDRHVYGMEIEPKYCAVILERMSTLGVNGKLAKE